MQTCTYIWPNVTTAKSNYTYAVKKDYTLRKCVATLPDIELWNCNLCGSDEEYYTPYVEGDKVYLQYLVNSTYTHILFEAVNEEGDVILSSPSLVIEQGQDENEQKYINAIFSMDDYPADVNCIYFRAKFFKCTLNEMALAACIAEHTDLSEYEALNACYTDLCVNLDYYRTQPYRRLGCFEKSVLVEGYYPGTDCNGNYYGAFSGGGSNSFIPSIRIHGELFKKGLQYAKTTLNNKVTGTVNTEVWNLKSKKLPPYVIDIMDVCFGSENLYLDGEEFINGTTIDKNHEEGRMWIVDTNVNKQCKKDTLSCE